MRPSFLILILGLFGSQPPFAKPKFGSHSLVGMCLAFATLWLATLWLATLYCPHGLLVIETMLPHLHKLVLQNESHKLASLRESCHIFCVYLMWGLSVA